MTKEELKEHCKKQIENCEMWAAYKGEEPHGKVYEEHKLILELLEQYPVLDKVRAEIEQRLGTHGDINFYNKAIHDVLMIIDKYKAEREEKIKIVEDFLGMTGGQEFHCGFEESGGHAYNCNDCPNKCEECYQWDKEFKEAKNEWRKS